MIIGFTGTRLKMNPLQRRILIDLLGSDPRFENDEDADEIYEFHHGDCVGADRQAFQVARDLGWTTFSHPGIGGMRAGTPSDVILTPKPLLERDKDIAEVCDYLMATPHTEVEVRRSGTWTTVRYARSLGKPILIILPSGQVKEERL
jgi:hypothetical protein